nr:unnamed protein product [Callosobruchus chinensis]
MNGHTCTDLPDSIRNRLEKIKLG